MDCRDFRTHLKDVDLKNNSLTDRCREHLEKCRSCRVYFESLRLVEHAGVLSAKSPAGLEERVMEGISFNRNLHPHRRARQPVESRGWVRLAAAAVLLVVVSVSLTLGFAKGNRDDLVIIHLHLAAPGAEEVAVVGDWNEWEAGTDLLQDTDGDGVWEIRLEISRGQEYRYQFLIDGHRWIADPSAPLKVDDGFGGTNSILDI